MIIVTGATGFVGRYLVDHLVKAGEKVLATGRNTKYEPFFRSLGVAFLPLDVSKPESYSVLPVESDTVFVHLAAVIPAVVADSRSDVFLKVNTLGTFYALEYCRRTNIRKFLFATTRFEAMGHTEMPITEEMGRKFSLVDDHASYVISKIAAAEYVEHYAQMYEMQGIILRLTGLLGYGREEGAWVNGVFHRSAFEVFYERAKQGLPIEVWGAHVARRDALYVKDTVRAISMAIASNDARGIYSIGSGVGRTTEEEALAFATVFGTSNKPGQVVYRPELPEKPETYYFNIDKARREFGWEPVYNYEDILRDYDMEVQSGRFKKVD
jgi:UDP-glucose 4-epimerase